MARPPPPRYWWCFFHVDFSAGPPIQCRDTQYPGEPLASQVDLGGETRRFVPGFRRRHHHCRPCLQLDAIREPIPPDGGHDRTPRRRDALGIRICPGAVCSRERLYSAVLRPAKCVSGSSTTHYTCLLRGPEQTSCCIFMARPFSPKERRVAAAWGVHTGPHAS